jgi:hypothetical protein
VERPNDEEMRSMVQRAGFSDVAITRTVNEGQPLQLVQAQR